LGWAIHDCESECLLGVIPHEICQVHVALQQAMYTIVSVTCA